MRYRVYSCCTDESSPQFRRPARQRGVHDNIDDALDQIRSLADKGQDAWYETEDDDD